MLPARFPNLLVNGSGGIAVGMATNIPPHNLGEVIDAVAHFIDHPESTPAELMKFMKGPDFPTGGTIIGKQGIRDTYETGRGSIKVRAVSHDRGGPPGPREDRGDGAPVPGQQGAAGGEDRGARQRGPAEGRRRRQGRVQQARACAWWSSIKRGANPQVVLNQLYKHTQLQDNFGAIMLALVDGVPRTLNLAELVGYYVDHQVDVVTRRTRTS